MFVKSAVNVSGFGETLTKLLTKGVEAYTTTTQAKEAANVQKAIAAAEKAKSEAVIAQSQVTPGATTQTITRTLLYGGVGVLGAVVIYKLIAGGSSYAPRRRYRR